ncbi:MAG: fused MFS/spermidine synthase [Bacteroidota bacterium]
MSPPYSLITISIITAILYSLTYILNKLKIVKLSTHRKIWNSLLLITFFVMGVLGIILVVQVNYKLEIPLSKEILLLHVDFAIAMFIIAIFHFLWHFKYFKNIFINTLIKREKTSEISASYNAYIQREDIKIPLKQIDNRLKLSVLALGITALITQIILLREFLSVFYGNELVIGIILANWMLLTGIGSYFGKYSDRIANKTTSIIILQVLIAILPIITVFLLSSLRNIVFPVGGMISFIQILYSSFILLLPFCLISGFLFTLFCNLISEKYKANLISKVYSLEAIGSITGGLLFNFVLIYFLKTFQSLIVLMIINLTVSFILSLKLKVLRPRYIILLLSFIFLFLTLYFNLDNISKNLLFKNQELIYQKDTPYGNLIITKSGEQENFYENNVLLFSTNNVIANEEDVHYAMLQHSNPENVLLISGGISGTTQEILKYNVNKIDYVEINPWLIDIGKNYTSALENKKINVINEDARLFIKNTSELYDIVLINLPEPGTAQINRFYTMEFFRELKKKLNKDAVISLRLMSTENYMSEEAGQIHSVIFNTLKTAFNNILIVPGEKNYFLASDKELKINVVQMIEKRGIENEYVQYYLDDQLLGDRSNYILSNLDVNADINKDFIPVSYHQQLLYWLSYFKFNYWFLTAVLLIVVLFIILRLNPVNLGLLTGGFAASSIEVLLLISFQIIYGYVYQMMGIIITLFMAGIAVGALYRHKILRIISVNNFIKIQFGIGLYSILLPFILLGLKTVSIDPVIIHLAFFLLTFFFALLIGMEFSLASKLQSGKISSIAAGIYSVDLLGSAIGALVVTAYLIPVLGIVQVGIIIGLLNFASGVVCFIKRKKYLSLD